MGKLVDTSDKSKERNDKRYEQIKKHLSQIANVHELKKSDGNMPSQVIHNPKRKVNVVTLRTGRVVLKEADTKVQQRVPPSATHSTVDAIVQGNEIAQSVAHQITWIAKGH